MADGGQDGGPWAVKISRWKLYVEQVLTGTDSRWRTAVRMAAHGRLRSPAGSP